MSLLPLKALSILVVEDEPLIAMDLADTLKQAGAQVAIAHTVKHALILIEHDSLGAIIVDRLLRDGKCTPICHRLNERSVPFIMYSGAADLDCSCKAGTLVSKPAHPDFIVSAIADMLQSKAGPSLAPALLDTVLSV